MTKILTAVVLILLITASGVQAGGWSEFWSSNDWQQAGTINTALEELVNATLEREWAVERDYYVAMGWQRIYRKTNVVISSWKDYWPADYNVYLTLGSYIDLAALTSAGKTLDDIMSDCENPDEPSNWTLQTNYYMYHSTNYFEYKGNSNPLILGEAFCLGTDWLFIAEDSAPNAIMLTNTATAWYTKAAGNTNEISLSVAVSANVYVDNYYWFHATSNDFNIVFAGTTQVDIPYTLQLLHSIEPAGTGTYGDVVRIGYAYHPPELHPMSVVHGPKVFDKRMAEDRYHWLNKATVAFDDVYEHSSIISKPEEDYSLYYKYYYEQHASTNKPLYDSVDFHLIYRRVEFWVSMVDSNGNCVDRFLFDTVRGSNTVLRSKEAELPYEEGYTYRDPRCLVFPELEYAE